MKKIILSLLLTISTVFLVSCTNLESLIPSDTFYVGTYANLDVDVSVKGIGYYEPGDKITLELGEFSDKYEFIGWFLDSELISEENLIDLKVYNNKIYETRFKKTNGNTYKVTVNYNRELGSVWGQGSFSEYDNIELRANASSHSEFVGWYGENNILLSSKRKLTMTGIDKDITLNAVFQTKENKANTLTLLYDKSIIELGEDYEINYLRSGYQFDGWYDDDGNKVTNIKHFESVITEDTTLNARISKKSDIYYVDIISNSLFGSVSSIGGANNRFYGHNEKINLVVMPKLGYRVKEIKYNGIVYTDTIDNYYVTEKTTVEVVFERNTKYTLKANFLKSNGLVTGAGEYFTGDKATLVAIPKPGYVFSGWRINGTVVSNELTLEVVMNNNYTYEVYFTKNDRFKVEAKTNVPNLVIKGVGKIFVMDQRVVLSFNNPYGYKFDGWYDEYGELLTSANDYDFRITGNHFAYAKFSLE